MTTDWKALCVELAKVLAEEYGVQREFDSGDPLLGSGAIELLSRVRTALSQPEPEPLTQASIALQMLDAIEHDSLYPPEVTAPIRRALEELHHDH